MSLNSNLLLFVSFILLLFWQKKSPERIVTKDFSRTKAIFIFMLINLSFGLFLKKNIRLDSFILWNLSLHPLVAFLLLDYSTYVWHYLNHKIPFLWRFHQVHHSDRRLDTLSALRFHQGEYLLSFFYRALWIIIFNIPLSVIVIYELILTLCNLFHHSNIRLGVKLDSLLVNFIVTPLYHLRHHSYKLSQTDSNYSSIFTFWDKLHRTESELDLGITLGVPELVVRENWKDLLLLPLRKLKPWPKHYR
jgi:sterol desaturase/sphingolipid hydroxylase (fatty acid hydroxylase superfamily)